MGIVILAVIGVLVFSGGSKTVQPTTIQATEQPVSSVVSSVSTIPTTSVQGIAKTIKVKAVQFSFDPSIITVNQGDVVTIELTSFDVAHGISISEFGVDIKADAGQTVSGTFTASQKGTFPFSCNIPCGPGHREMTGTLIVK